MNCFHGLTSVVIYHVDKPGYLLYIRKHPVSIGSDRRIDICRSEVNTHVVTHVSRLT